VPAPPVREGGSLTWVTDSPRPASLQKLGWKVLSYRNLREQYIAPSRYVGVGRATLDNPARPLLDFLVAGSPIAVVGIPLATPADLRNLYGYVVEPAYRRGLTLLVATDRDLGALDPEKFVDPIGYAWTLERLQHIVSRFGLGPGLDGLPPLTPIEALLFDALRALGLAPVSQYGIAKYRADFALTDVRLVVECDGRPWHDPERDRRRDEALRRVGWEVIHFTGSEITRDAAACAAQVQREVAARLSTVESEPVRVEVPVARTSWARLLGWLRSRLADPGITSVPAVALDESDQQGAPVSPWTAGLDREQQAAVMSHDGVVQVIAPAGSGKTTVLIARVRELVSRGVPPNRILCCTFNKAAADELQTRLDQAGVEGVEAGTFHAIGRRILQNADCLRGDVLRVPYGQWRHLTKRAMDETPGGRWIEAPDAKELISDIKLGQMLTVEEFASTEMAHHDPTLATLYRLYEDVLALQGRTDFDDHIFGAVRLLQRDSAVRRHWQSEFAAILVDEYQDIEPAQELLIRILAAPQDLLMTVGDEDQCLYAWRRASVERVIELDQVYPGLERHALTRNYRCPSTIVEASRSLIGHNRRRFPKQILPAKVNPGKITLAPAADLQAQGAHAARLVKDLRQDQVVILARTTRVLSEIAVGLAQAGVCFYGPAGIKRQSGEPAVLLSYLKLLGAPLHARPEDVEQVFRVPNRYLPDDAADDVARVLRAGGSFATAVGRLRVREGWRRPMLAKAADLFDSLTAETHAARLVARLRVEGGLDRHFADAEQLNQTERSAVDGLSHAEEAAAGMTVIEFAGVLAYQSSIIEKGFDPKGVELATIHGAKGRQWPIVILAAAQEGEMPHARSLGDADDPLGAIEGERRLAYVAFTRSRDELVLMYNEDCPSLFIAEAARSVYVPPVESRREFPLARPMGAVAESVSPYSRPTQPAPKPNRYRAGIVPAPPKSPPGPRAGGRVGQPVGPRHAPALVGGAIRCSLPGCGGVVKPEYAFAAAGLRVGLCPQRAHHAALAAREPSVAAELRRLEDASRAVWLARRGRGGSD
jgi:DNA helicase-2/ATP-dependent DNA helicase PcrA